MSILKLAVMNSKSVKVVFLVALSDQSLENRDVGTGLWLKILPLPKFRKSAQQLKRLDLYLVNELNYLKTGLKKSLLCSLKITL